MRRRDGNFFDWDLLGRRSASAIAWYLYCLPRASHSHRESSGAWRRHRSDDPGWSYVVDHQSVHRKASGVVSPVVIGILLVVTGLSLMRIATNVALGANTPYFGKTITIFFLIGSVVLIGFIANLRQKVVKSLSVLFAVIAIYLVGMAIGFGDFSTITKAPWVRLPTLLPYGFAWPDSAGLTTILVDHLVAAVYTMSITLALCAMVGIDQSGLRIRGAVAGDGLGSVLAALFGGVSLISYDQNVGAISLRAWPVVSSSQWLASFLS